MSLDAESETDRKAVREQLDRILKSAPFHQSRRRQRFLEYIVTETLAGRGDRLKGYAVAREVFDRSDGFDANVDPVVRIEAGRLRDKLREYYETEGRDDPIRIDLPKGTYTPLISVAAGLERPPHQAESKPEGPQSSAAEPMNQTPTQAHLRLDRPAQWRIAVPLLALALALGAGGVWFLRTPSDTTPSAAADDPALAAPPGPAIAVLPFINLAGDPKQDYFSDGLTEDILTELSRARDLRVLARNTSFRYKGQAVDVIKLGRDLGVRYVLEGSVRRTDDRLRVTAQLIDAETGTHVWADRFDREMADVLLVQDEIVSRIAAKVAGGYGAIETTEARLAARKGPDELQAYDLVLRARDRMQWDWTGENFRTARDLLDQAIVLDPANAQARRELAWFAVIGWIFKLDETPVAPQVITEAASKAVQLDPADARARMVGAAAYFFTKQLDLFAHETDQALALAPNDAEITVALACMISSSGDHARGVDLAKKAYALNADATVGWYHSTVYTAAYLEGDYERALEIARQNKEPSMFYSYLEIIPILGQLGRREDALEAWRKLREQMPDASAASFESWWRLWNIREDEVARLMDGVYRSGVLSVPTKTGP